MSNFNAGFLIVIDLTEFKKCIRCGTSSLLPKRHRNRRVVLLTSPQPDSFLDVKF
jgi:hypothetical protein